MKRTIHAICIALVTLPAFACQRTKEAPKEAADEAQPEGSPKTAAGPVQTTTSPARSGADAMSEVTIKTTQVAGTIYMLEGRGGNMGVSAGEDGVLLVDDQFAPLAPKITEAVRALGKGEPEFVINTHWHGDHTGGNTEFGPKAAIVSHENVRKRLSTRQERRGKMIEPTPAPGLPVVTFQQSISLHMNGEEVRIVHFPSGHTDGDSIVFFTGANVVHMGDLFFNGRFPLVDIDSGGEAVRYAENVKAVLDQIKDDTKIIPGHGPLATKADLAAFHAMMIDTIKVVRTGKKAGKSLAELQKAGFPEKYRTWGEGFIKPADWVEAIYTSLK